MMARIRKQLDNKDHGFTLIELLVVMIIIGILAAIAIPIFLSQREKAQDSAAKADVSTIGKEVATYYVDNTQPPSIGGGNGSAWTLTPAGTGATAETIGNSSDGVYLVDNVASTATSTTWCVSVKNDQGDVAKDSGYKYSAQGGLEEGTC